MGVVAKDLAELSRTTVYNMRKRFYKLKRGEQFDSGDGWDMLKVSAFYARPAHARFEAVFFSPLQFVNTIEPNPNCDDCPCSEFPRSPETKTKHK